MPEAHEEREEVVGGEHAAAHQQHRGVGGSPVAVAEQTQGHHRVRAARLDDEEAGQEQQSGKARAEGHRVGPARIPAADDGVDEDEKPEAAGERAGKVKPSPDPGAFHQDSGPGQDGQADGDVDE